MTNCWRVAGLLERSLSDACRRGPTPIRKLEPPALISAGAGVPKAEPRLSLVSDEPRKPPWLEMEDEKWRVREEWLPAENLSGS